MPTDPIQSDSTLNPSLKSWVESANDPASDFPIQNLPLAVMQKSDSAGEYGVLATVIGDRAMDLTPLYENGIFDEAEFADDWHDLFEQAVWNVAPLTREHMSDLRRILQEFLLEGPVGGQQTRRLRDKVLSPLASANWFLPATMMNYTDFYASIHHARNVGSMFRPDNPLLPNYKHVPIGYHGRPSSLIVSGADVRRPRGQTRPDDAAGPVFGPCKRMDYEAEIGCVMGTGNDIGQPIPIQRASDAMLGLCLVNDWSARDVQAWEYQPLGPFLAKNFATSVSPFVVTANALRPFEIPGPARQADDPQPLDYLRSDELHSYDLNLEVHLQSAAMAAKGMPPIRLSRGNLRDMYWTFAQMIAHHTCNGCNLLPGDLLASGTVSGPEPESRGCMLELTWDGNGPDGKPKPRKPISLPTGETRTFLEDGDTVTMTAWCMREGYRRIGFGQCVGRITPAV